MTLEYESIPPGVEASELYIGEPVCWFGGAGEGRALLKGFNSRWHPMGARRSWSG